MGKRKRSGEGGSAFPLLPFKDVCPCRIPVRGKRAAIWRLQRNAVSSNPRSRGTRALGIGGVSCFLGNEHGMGARGGPFSVSPSGRAGRKGDGAGAFSLPMRGGKTPLPEERKFGTEGGKEWGKRPPEAGARRRPETPGAGRFPACFRFHRSGQTGTNRTIVKKRTKYGTAKTRMRSRSCFLPFFEVQHPLLLGRGGLSCRLPHGYSCPSRWP